MLVEVEPGVAGVGTSVQTLGVSPTGNGGEDVVADEKTWRR